jgi:DNA-binding CsgD family transcriptional regulator/tetratricopeptide (TPR) repeat protein
MSPALASRPADRHTGRVATRVTSARLVGRTRELAELEAALAEVAGGRAGLVLVAGESGVGKTRLLAELVRRAEAAGVRTFTGDCVELGEGELPYAPLVGALRPLARDGDPILDALSPATRAELARLLPALGTPPADDRQDGAAQGRLFEALLTLLDRLGEQAPVLLVLEDLHWADRSTRAFLAFLARSLCRERVLVVGSYRADELHRRHPLRPLVAELERDPEVHRLELAPLTRDELAAALEDILGAPPAADLVDRLHARSEGNPLFMEELLATGLDGRGALPSTLRDALMVRIERLSEPAQEVLRVLAVGQRLDHEILAEVSGLSARELREALREAVASHLVTIGEDGTHAFRHMLLREVVHDDLLPGEHGELHRALARALERRLAAGGPTVYVTAGIAHHHLAAGDQPAALAAAVRAGHAAEQVQAHGEAAALFERALELWDRVPEPAALAGADHVEILAAAARAHHGAGEKERAEVLLRAALGEVDETAEPARAAALLERLASAQWALSHAQDALASARRGLDLLPAEHPCPERAALLSWWAKTRMLQGKFREAAEVAEEAQAVAAACGDQRSLGSALNAQGVSLFALGEVEAGEAALRRALAIAREHGQPDEMDSAYNNLADALHLAGRTPDALAVLREGVDALAAISRTAREWLLVTHAEVSFAAGDWELAASLLPGEDRRFDGRKLLYVELRRAELALGRGEHEAAGRHLARVAEAAARSSEPQFIGAYGTLLAELRRREGDLDAARAAVETTLDCMEFCTEDVGRLAVVAAAGVTVEADRAQRARDLGDAEEEAQALARLEGYLLRVEAAAEDEARPVERAWLATSRAEASRGRGEADAAAWARAAAAWEAISRPYPAAEARWREAEARLSRGEADPAVEPARAALEGARRLGATYLAGEVEGLAARARLRVAEQPEEPAPAPAAEEPFGLTPRERQVLALVARGATNREIGAELYMAEKTASVHVSRILAKLDVRSRTQAAAVAHRLGLETPAR